MIELRQVEFAYGGGPFRLEVESFHVRSGEHVALIGPSGSGKSTLLHLIAGILAPRRGEIRVDGIELSRMTDAARRRYRISAMGLVFQEFELLEYLDVAENILLPFRLNGSQRISPDVRRRGEQLARDLEIHDKSQRLPGELSQGERQRIAIARALVSDPRLLLADEPTGNLDPANKHRVLELMLHQATQRELTVLMVTHDHSLLDRFERVIDVADFHQRGPAKQETFPHPRPSIPLARPEPR